jgi:tRNA (guanine26-N2/guanine27-N2)-dimethyltransferase
MYNVMTEIMEDEFQIIREGQAIILLPKDQENVFYNRVQEFNRDLSVAVIQLFEQMYSEEKRSLGTSSSYQGLNILEAFSATGLRAIRYAKEIQGIHQVIANDYSQNAIDMIQKNSIHNLIPANKVIPHYSDAK